jgi:hypothetical protein
MRKLPRLLAFSRPAGVREWTPPKQITARAAHRSVFPTVGHQLNQRGHVPAGSAKTLVVSAIRNTPRQNQVV